MKQVCTICKQKSGGCRGKSKEEGVGSKELIEVL